MYYVYILKSINFPEKIYVGYTENLKQRIIAHNSGQSVHTAQFKPWKLIIYLAFADEIVAKNFEKYLKSHSGRSFGKKRFWC